MMAVNLPINHCLECPHHATERYYTADSFEYVTNLFCKKTDRPRPETTDRQVPVIDNSRIGFIDSGSNPDNIKIPDWCPLR